MNDNLGCPPLEILEELIQGKLVEPDLSDLSLHLEKCSACQQKAKTLVPSDTLVEWLRGEAPIEDQIARDVPRPLIEKLKQIPRRESNIGSIGAGTGNDTGLPPETFDFLSPAQEADELGRLGQYRVLKILGKGGMGVVFLAEDPKLGRRVALKVMLPRIAADPTAKDRFLREARAAARLKNDHIVTIYQVDEINGMPYLAMELLEGQSLDDVLRAGKPLSARQVMHFARDIAKGLAAAHEKGLVHRDIKLGNLWLEETLDAGFRVKILDFGLARAAQEDSHITQSGAIVGTPAYMAPEQAHGGKSVDARSDLFSLGCVLYHLCAREVPFKAETTLGTLLAVAMHEPVKLTTKNDSIPPVFSQLIMQLLQKDPDHRPQSAQEVIARLGEIERGTNGTYESEVSQRSHVSSHVFHLILGLLAVVVVLMAGVFFWQTPDGRVVRIESDDSSIQVAFNHDELKVIGAYKEPITLKPGKVDLKIVKKGASGDDFEFETNKLIVNKGDKIILRIEVVEGQVQIVQAGKGVLDSKSLTPPDKGDSWEKSVAQMEARDQVTAVGIRLKNLNPNFDERSLSHKIENGVVVNLAVGDASALKDLTPLRALTGLKALYLDGKSVGAADIGPLRGMKLVDFQSNGCPHQDLSPLKGMPLTKANFWGCATTDLSPLIGMKLVETNVGNSTIKDISVLKGMPLEFVCLNISQVDDLSPLAGMPLKRLFAAHTKVTDLKPVANAPIEWLTIDGSPIEDLTPLLTMRLQMLEIDNPRQHAELLLKIPTLKTINHKPVAEVLGAATESTDADRRAAEWVLRLGGIVQVNDVQRDIKTIADLPKDRFTVTNVNVVYNRAVTDSSLENLGGLKGLKWLNLGGTSVTDEGLIRLKELKGLTSLSLERLKLTKTGLAHLKDLKELQMLQFNEVPLTDDGLSELMVHKGLQVLVLSNTRLSGEGLARLKHFKGLNSLNLRGTAATDDTLEHFQDLDLISLDLSETKLTDTGLARLKLFKRLQNLWVEKTAVTAKGLADFRAALPACKVEHDDATESTDADRRAAEWVLSIGGSVQVNDVQRDIKAVAELPKDRFNLTEAKLHGNKGVTDAGLAHLKDVKGLTSLKIDHTNVSDAGLGHLKDLRQLTWLDISSTKVTDNGLAVVRNFKALETLFLDTTSVTDAGLVQLKDLKELTSIALGITKVTDDGLVHIEGLSGLTALSLYATAVTDAGLVRLKGFQQMKNLDLTRTAVTDKGVVHLQALMGLTTLHLCAPNLTDEGLAHLQVLKRLTFLGIKETKVTRKGLADFHAAVPGCKVEHDDALGASDPDRTAAEWVLSIGGKVRVNSQEREITAVADLPPGPFTLTWINLVGTKVTDADLPQLKDVNALNTLLLDGTTVTDDGLARLKNLKKLESLHLDGVSGVTDAGLPQLKELTGLKHLWLGGTSVTDTGMRHLIDVEGLVYLGLNSTVVTDTGLAHVQELKKMAYLFLNNTRVTDSGLTQLKGLTQLFGLDLRNTKVTAAGVAELHTAVPGCRIDYDGGAVEANK